MQGGRCKITLGGRGERGEWDLHRRRPRAVAVQKVAALDHEGLDDAVELGQLVALQRGRGGGPVPDAVLAEVLGRERSRVRVEEHLYAAEGFAWRQGGWDVSRQRRGFGWEGGTRMGMGLGEEVGGWHGWSGLGE